MADDRGGSLDERIASALADAAAPIPFAQLRSKCRVRAATLYERLSALTASGRIVKAGNGGYRLHRLNARTSLPLPLSLQHSGTGTGSSPGQRANQLRPSIASKQSRPNCVILLTPEERSHLPISVVFHLTCRDKSRLVSAALALRKYWAIPRDPRPTRQQIWIGEGLTGLLKKLIHRRV